MTQIPPLVAISPGLQALSSVGSTGISLIGPDGSMTTSTCGEPAGTSLGGLSPFRTPGVFNTRYLEQVRCADSSITPSEPETRRPSTIPPPGASRERALGILGRSIYRELRGFGYENNTILGVAAWLLSQMTEMLSAEQVSEKRQRAKNSSRETSGLAQEHEEKLLHLLRGLRLEGCPAPDLVRIASEILGRVSGDLQGVKAAR